LRRGGKERRERSKFTFHPGDEKTSKGGSGKTKFKSSGRRLRQHRSLKAEREGRKGLEDSELHGVQAQMLFKRL